MPKQRSISRMAECPPPPGDRHEIDAHNIRDYDELNECSERLCHVWCKTCGAYEWHWIDEDYLDEIDKVWSPETARFFALRRGGRWLLIASNLKGISYSLTARSRREFVYLMMQQAVALSAESKVAEIHFSGGRIKRVSLVPAPEPPPPQA